MRPIDINLLLNGELTSVSVEPRELLGHVLRERLDCRGVHVACAIGECGSCTVLVNGEAVRSCLMLAVQANDSDIRTISGTGNDGMHPLQQALKTSHGVQCGYCTAGFVLAGVSYLYEEPAPSRAQIEADMAGHLCRCTGYVPIVDAIEACAAKGSDELA